MIRKARERDADVLILDLEDGVLPDGKEEARACVRWSLESIDFGRSEVWVRVNPLSTPWGEGDVAMVATLRPPCVLLPKAEVVEDVTRVDESMSGGIAIALMIETIRGVDAVHRLIEASPRTRGVVLGAADYRASLGAGRLPDELELLYARFHLIHAARTADIEAFDTPWFDYRDTQGLERSARRVRELGFDGKAAVHPLQVPVINEVFSPTPFEIQRARRLVAVLERAAGEGRAVATLDGEMVEPLHLKAARRTLDRARAAGLVSEDEAL